MFVGTVFYPADASKTYPLLSFAHGWTEGGQFTDVNYQDLLETVAAAGYVVVAHHSGLVTECQDIYPKDQQRAIAFIKETKEFNARVDWSSKVGIYGHSMGGGATGDNAADSLAISTYNLGAAVLLHPVARSSRPKIPTFFATGSNDHICSAAGVEAWSRKAAKPTVFAEMQGANHFECQSKEDGLPCPHGWTNYVINWFNCYIKGSKDECSAAYSVCTHPTKPMTKCTPQPGANLSHIVEPARAPQPSSRTTNSSGHHILIFGDSWGQFAAAGGVLPAMLKRHGVSDTTVSSTAISGSTACQWADKPESLLNAVASSNADFVWFTAGGNDLLNIGRQACLRTKCTQQDPWNCPCDTNTYVPRVLGCAKKLLDPLFKRFPHVQVLNFFYDIPCLGGVGCFPDLAAPDCGLNKTCVVEGQKFWQQSYSQALGAEYENVHSINLLGTAQAAAHVPGASIGNPVHQGSPCSIMSVLCEHPSAKGWEAESEAMWQLFFSKYLGGR